MIVNYVVLIWTKTYSVSCKFVEINKFELILDSNHYQQQCNNFLNEMKATGRKGANSEKKMNDMLGYNYIMSLKPLIYQLIYLIYELESLLA